MPNIYDSDSDKLVQLLEEKKILNKDCVNIITGMHKVSYSLALWSYIHKDSENESKYFLDEIRSDCVQAIPLLLMGYKKATSILFRGLVENSIKHIYFYHHPIELYRYFNEESYYLPMEDLYKYIYHHPIYADKINKLDFPNILRDKYHGFSFLIHGKTMESLQFYKSINQIKFDKSFLIKYHGELKSIGSVINYMFCLFYWKEFYTYKKDYRDVIFENMTPSHKKLLYGIK